MARLVRAATDRNPPTLGGGGCHKNPENEDEVIAPITSSEVCSVCKKYEPFVEDTENTDDSEIEFETL